MEQINRDARINTVAEYFINRPSVSAIYLFGSFAKGLARKNRDIDIGVLFAAGMSPLERFEQKLEITNDLEDLLKLKIDVVDLESADLFFLHQVMTHKLLLLDRDVNRRVFFEVKKRQEYFDRTHFYELYHRQALKRLDDQRSKYYHG